MGNYDFWIDHLKILTTRGINKGFALILFLCYPICTVKNDDVVVQTTVYGFYV